MIVLKITFCQMTVVYLRIHESKFHSFLFIFWASKILCNILFHYFAKKSQTMAYKRQGERGILSQVPVTTLLLPSRGTPGKAFTSSS